jgi:hypothetical protein
VLGSIEVVPSVAIYLLLLCASVVPRAEDPLPDEIGFSAPFVGAGAGGVLAGIEFFAASAPRRERAMKVGSFIGFSLGAGAYLLALAVQLL